MKFCTAFKIFSVTFFFCALFDFQVAAQQINASQAVKTLPTYTQNVDLNTGQNWGGAGATGMYMFNANKSPNVPPEIASSDTWMHIIEMQHDNNNTNWMAQIGINYFSDGGLYWRQQNDGNWRSWNKVASQQWVTQQLATGSFLPLTGGTVNGNIRITNGNMGINTSNVIGALTAASNENNVYTPIAAFYAPNNAIQGHNSQLVFGAQQAFGDAAEWRFYYDALNSGKNRVDFGFIGYAAPALSYLVNGNVGIGTINPGIYKLAVEGSIGVRKVVVTQAPNWADYVFHKNYKLMPLSTLAAYIKANKHLPEIPSAKVIAQDGLDLAETQKLMMQKIEELTLYIIEQDKQIKRLTTAVTHLKSRRR